jgi:hypothetical protein
VEDPLLVEAVDREADETPEDELDPDDADDPVDGPDDAVCALGVDARRTGADDAAETGLPGPPGRSGPESADGMGIGAFAGAAIEGTVAGIGAAGEVCVGAGIAADVPVDERDIDPDPMPVIVSCM